MWVLPTEWVLPLHPTAPTYVKFARLADRNVIWKKKNNITAKEGEHRVMIQVDLAKNLRADVQLLYRVVRAASSMPDFQTAMVRNYAVVLHGKEYTAQKLETLPEPSGPPSLAFKFMPSFPGIVNYQTTSLPRLQPLDTLSITWDSF